MSPRKPPTGEPPIQSPTGLQLKRSLRWDIVDSKEVVWYENLPYDTALVVAKRSEAISTTKLELRVTSVKHKQT